MVQPSTARLAWCVCALTLFAPRARADETLAVQETKAERRSGFMTSLTGGLAFGYASGNPESFTLRNDPAMASSTGFAVGYRLTPVVGGALTDWFNVGLGMTAGTIEGSGLASSVTSFVFHLEAFPLYTMGGQWRDLGLMADFGAGTSAIERTATGAETASSGVMSTVGLGAFWEPWRWWHLAVGPSISYQHNWSLWYVRNDVTLGLRGVFYGGP